MKYTLEVQREAFASRKFLAMPLAGLIVWLIIGLVGSLSNEFVAVWSIFIGSGSIVYLGMFISNFTGENFLDKQKPRNVFDGLFLYIVFQALMVYAIAIPFFLQDHTSLALSVGILTGLMWLPFSWIIQHWVGIFHTISRTVLILIVYYLFPDFRFVVVPFAIVFIYTLTIIILNNRKRIRQMTDS
jgi:hypothetical protein